MIISPPIEEVSGLYHQGELLVWPTIELTHFATLQSLSIHNNPKWKKLKSKDAYSPIKNLDTHPLSVWAKDIDGATLLQKILRSTEREIYHYVKQWFPDVKLCAELHSWRYTVTTDEPLHFDVYADRVQEKVLRIFVNLDTEDRVWHIAPDAKYENSHFDPVYKANVIDAPYQTINFQPKCAWSIDSRKIAHAIIYGRRAAMFSYQLCQE